MDPDACFTEIVYHFGKRNWNECFDHADLLVQWMERGGFAPMNAIGDHARDILGFARMARRIAKSALERMEG